MAEPHLDLLPLGPFPSWGPARQGQLLDLGALLRDQLMSRRALWGPVRRLLQGRLARALEAGQHQRAAALLVDWLDTWPVGAAADPAISGWCTAPQASDLAVLARAAQLVAAAMDWPRLAGTPWPRPSAEWLEEQVAGHQLRLLGRGAGDQREVVAAALGLGEVAEERDPGLPPVEQVAGEALEGERARLAAALVRGELGAVALSSPVPPSPGAQLALGELRLEGEHQAAYERYGPAGLRVRGLVDWEEVVEAAPAGEPGPVLQSASDALLAPGTPASMARGELDTVGWLVWHAPFRPVPVHPVAVHVLRALDGQLDTPALAEVVKGPPDLVQRVLDDLVAVGAATAA